MPLPLIPVMSGKNLKAWPKHAEGGAVQRMQVDLALRTRHATDAHFAAYEADKARRLSTGAITQADVRMVLVIFDVDGHGHAATNSWWEEERAKVHGLLEAHPDGFVYRTRGGYRIVYLTTLPIFVRDDSDRYAWWALYCAWVNHLNRVFGIAADPSCKDFTRLFRLPNVLRDGKRDELEVIGDATRIGKWSPELTGADMEGLDSLAHKTIAPAQTPTGNYRGRGRLVDAFDKRGWLGKEIETGKIAVRCPWEQAHSMGTTFDTSTVIYEADLTRGDLGWFHCSHGHCMGRDVSEVIALFDDEEMSNPPKCGRTTKSGKACAATELYSDGKCVFHSDSTEARQARRDHVAGEAQHVRESDEGSVPTTSVTTDPVTIGFKKVSDRMIGEREERIERSRRIMNYGVRYLDEVFGGLFPNDLLLIGAYPGEGKTAMCTILSRHLVKVQKKRVHYFALEAEDCEIERRLKYQEISELIYRADECRPIRPRLNYIDWYKGLLDRAIGPAIEDAVGKIISERFATMSTMYKKGRFDANDLEKHLLAIQDETDCAIIDHLHYLDIDGDNENRGVKDIVVRTRDAALMLGKSMVLVAHLRKKERKTNALVPDLDDFHGTSEIPKIATKAIMIARAKDQQSSERHLWPTYIYTPKCRMDGTRTRYAALCMFNARTQAYEDTYVLGTFTPALDRFEALPNKDLPLWAENAFRGSAAQDWRDES